MKKITFLFKLPRDSSKFNICALLLMGMIFFSLSISAQIQNPISISWGSGVGCQEYDSERDHGKEDIFIEDIKDSACFRVCENANITYYLINVPAGTTVNWTVVGGVIESSSNFNCVVTWGAEGMGSLDFQIVSATSVLSKSLCFEKIRGPLAFFSVIPDPNDGNDYIYVCSEQTISFTNQSNPNGGTAIVSYNWNFGDGTTSSAENPTHVFHDVGIYEVELTVTNACNCTNTYSLKVKVDSKGFDITCPSIVCEGQTATYSLPFDGMETCEGNYNWSVEGGEIINIADNGDLTVLWNSVDASGFGYVTFDPSKCHLECYSPTTIRVPVIQAKGTIVGPETLCANSSGRYKLPQWPTTDFQWELIQEANIAEIILTDQRNEVVIKALEGGYIILKATYLNTLTNCTGIATFQIYVESSKQIVGNSNFCVGSQAIFTTSGGAAATWTLYDNQQNIITTTGPSSQFQYHFSNAGNYILSTAGSALCEGGQKVIKVINVPTAVLLANIEGDLEVCPTQPNTYNIQNADPNSVYVWTITGGNFNGSHIGPSIIASFNANGPYSLSVVRQSIDPIVCESQPTSVPISLQKVLVEIASENNATQVCANTYQDFYGYKIGTTSLYTQGEIYSWSISDTSKGSVTEGQGTNAATILWYTVAAPTVVDVILTISKCTLPPQVFTYSVTITPTPIIQINGPSSLCSGESGIYYLSLLNGVSLPSNTPVIWNNGGVLIPGTMNQPLQFNNNGDSNIGRTITAHIANVPGCNVKSNTASFDVVVKSAPAASLTIVSGGNSYCDISSINTVLAIGSATNNLIIKWYRNGDLILGANNTTYIATQLGNYSFTAENPLTGCIGTSNVVRIIYFCPTQGACTQGISPQLTNDSYNDCGTIYLVGSASPNPVNSNFRIVGPNMNTSSFSGTQFDAEAGIYHIFYNASYYCTNGDLFTKSIQKDVLVPYVPKFAYNTACSGDNTFTVTLFDETNLYSAVTNANVSYKYRLAGTPLGSSISIAGSQISGLAAGTYIFTQTVTAPGYDACSTELQITLSALPSGMEIVVVNPINCYDTAVGFLVQGSSSLFSHNWSFDVTPEGIPQSTLEKPKRVFSSSGLHSVYVTVTNNYGCSEVLELDVMIPEKCFSGVITSIPSPASVCVSQSVTLSYVEGSGDCPVTQYIWMNGLDPVAPAVNIPNLTVSTSGSYWVKVISEDGCEYSVLDRISPIFKPAPTLILSAPASFCVNEAVTIIASTNATAILWSVDNLPQPQYSNLTYLNLNGLSVGLHQISATAILDGCTKTNTISVLVMAAPTNVSIAQPQMISCSPYLYKLTAQSSTPNVQYSWSDGQVGSTIYVTSGGPYRVTAFGGGCHTSAQTDVPKDPEFYSWIFPSGCYDFCKESEGYLIGPRTVLSYWSWNKNTISYLAGTDSFPQQFSVGGAGDYSFTLNTGDCSLTTEPLVYSEVRCSDCDIKEVVLLDLSTNDEKFCSFDIVLNIESSDFLNAVISSVTGNMIVSPSGFSISNGSNNYQFTVIPVGNFAGGVVEFLIEGMTKEGQLCRYKFYLDLPSCGEQEATSTRITEDKRVEFSTLELYPNPTKDQVTLSYTGLDNSHQISIFDLTGRLMQLIQPTLGRTETVVDMAKYPTGVYIVVVRKEGNLISQHKLIKQ